MAILDERLEFMDAVDVSAAAGTALGGDVIDLGATPMDLGHEPLYLAIQVTTAFTTGGTAEVQFILASDAAAAIATDGTATYHAVTQAFDTGVLTAGTQLVIPLPVGANTLGEYERYLGVLVVTTTATTTAGSVNAFLTRDPINGWKSYADAAN